MYIQSDICNVHNVLVFRVKDYSLYDLQPHSRSNISSCQQTQRKPQSFKFLTLYSASSVSITKTLFGIKMVLKIKEIMKFFIFIMYILSCLLVKCTDNFFRVVLVTRNTFLSQTCYDHAGNTVLDAVSNQLNAFNYDRQKII